MAYLGKYETRTADFKVYTSSTATATHTLSWTPTSKQSLRITINGVVQQDDAFSLTGNTVTLDAAILVTDVLEIVGVNELGGQVLVPADGSIQTGKLGDNSVTLAKMADGTQGGIIHYGAAGAPTQLSAGTSGHYLKTQGAGANPVWAAVPAGFDSIALLSTQSASTTASVSFDNSLITSTYKTYELRFFNVVSVDDGINLRVKFSNDNGSTFSSFHTSGYDGAYTGASGAGSGYDTSNDVVGQDYMNVAKNSSWDAGDSIGGTIWIQDPTNSSFITTYQFLTSNISHDGTPYVYQLWGGGMWDATSGSNAVDYIRFFMSTGNISTGTFQLWGYK